MKAPTYSKYQKQQVESLAQQGISDSEISQKTKVGLSSVQTITTKYWKHKMQKAYEN